MATKLFRADGTKEIITPANGTNWTLKELQGFVGGYIEVLRTMSGRYLIVDEDGKRKQKPPNQIATDLYLYGVHDPVVGDALVIDTLAEMNGPDEEEE